MKRILIFTFAIIFSALNLQPATASTQIIITEHSHRQLDGKFFDDDLATLLAYGGRLGQLVFNPARGIRVWEVDAQLVDEVSAMSQGYKLIDGKDGTGKRVAQIWLSQLRAITYGDTTLALPYGNPSGYWIHRLAPKSAQFFLDAGAGHLGAVLGRQIQSVSEYQNLKYSGLDSLSVQAFLSLDGALKISGNFMDPQVLADTKFKSVTVFHPDLDKKTRNLLITDIFQSTNTLIHSVRLAPGRFTITSQKQNLPITIVNDFPKKVKIKILVSAMNGKVVVGDIADEDLAPNSKTQVLIPVQVLTSGASQLMVNLHSTTGEMLGDAVIYQLSLRFISPVATWLTTAAAVVLFLSAIIQSSRRIRRRRK